MSRLHRHSGHDPLFRIAKRDTMPFWARWLVRLGGVVLALILSSLFILAVTGLNPTEVFKAMTEGALGIDREEWYNSRIAWATYRDTMMLLCIGIGLAPAFKMKFWNIGAEGQVLVGGIVSAGMMLYLGDGRMSSTQLILLMAVGSVVIGAIWGVIPAIFKARWGTNETLFTLMMNYVALRFTKFFMSYWEQVQYTGSIGEINSKSKIGWLPVVYDSEAGWFPGIVDKKSFQFNVLIVLVLAILMFIYLRYSKQGYEITVLGESENTARYAGMKPAKIIIRTMAISGAICGLAGFIAVAGVDHTISDTTAGGQGFTAIIVAWLAKFNPFIMLLVAFLLAFMQNGAGEIATDFNIDQNVANVVIGVILFCIIASEFFINYRMIFRRRKGAEKV